MANTINCTVCGKLTDGRLDSCPHCGAYLKKRKAAPAPQQAAQQRKTCPQCRAIVEEGDIICVACGTNLLTGQKVVAETARREKSSRGLVIGGSIAAIVAICAGLFWIYTATGDPVASALRMIDNREYLEAQNELAAYVQDNPNDPRAYYELGRLQWRASQFDSAAASFAEAVDLDPSNSDAALWAVVALARSGSSGAGRRQIDYLERALTYESGDPVLWYLLALTRGAAGDLKGQIDALQRVIELRPTDDSARWSMGLAHALNGNYRDARGELALVGDGQRAADALAVRGFVANLEGSPGAAARNFEEALALDGATVAWQALTELGKLKMMQGEYQTAQVHLEEALGINSGSTYVQYLRAICLEARGRLQDALGAYETIERNAGEYAMESGVGAARVYLAMDMPDRAQPAIERAGRLDGDGAPYHTIRGMLRAIQGDDAGAATSFRRAIESDPSYGAAYLERGLLYVRNDDLAAGLKDLERYLELVGSNVRGTRAADVRALTDQLRQASDGAQRRRGAAR